MARFDNQCLDCRVYAGGASEHYCMLRHRVWAETGADDGLLCLNCIEQRIGRPLQYRDFLPCRDAFQREFWDGYARMLPPIWKAHLKARRRA